MKERVVIVACVAALLIVTVVSWAGKVTAGEALADEKPTSESNGTVTVTGDAEIRVVPDEVVLTLGVQTWDKNLGRAKSQNDEIVKRVLALAGDYGIPPEHVQTEYINIEPRYRNGYYEESDFIGYFVRKTIVLTLRDLDSFEDLLTEALEAGVNYVQGIQFRTTELRQHRDEARALAIQAAREKAEALAGGLDQGIGAPTSIVEQQSGWWSPYSSWWGGYWSGSMAQNVIQEIGSNAASGDGTLSPGQIKVNARVSVTFGLK